MLQIEIANDRLSKFNLTVDDILAEAPQLGDDGVIMLIGSVADGLATPLSDIDILVVGDRRQDGDLVLRESDRERAIRILDSGQEINIEYWRKDRLAHICDKFAQSAFAIDNPHSTDEILVFDDQEMRIVHYLINGLLVAGETRLFADKLNNEAFMDYLVMFCMTRFLALAEDSIGQAIENDYECASHHLRMAIEFLIGAEIASLGHTHPHLRWRLKLLRSSTPNIGEDVYQEYLSHLFGDPHTSRKGIESGLQFAQMRLGAIFARRPKVLVAAGALRERMKFVTSFNAE